MISNIQVDNVFGSGANFANAYFEIEYLRTYIAQDLAASPSTNTSTSSPVPEMTTKTVIAVTTTQAGTGGLSGVPTTSSAAKRTADGWGELGAFALALSWGWMVIVR